MKKILCLMMTLTLITTLLTGCQAGTANPPAESNAAAQPQEAVGPGSTPTPAKPLEGADIVIKMSHGDVDTSLLKPWNAYARVFKKNLEVYSGGTMTCEVYPGDSLGGTSACLEMCSQGSIQMAVTASVGALAGWVPNVSIFDIPYIISDMDACNIVLEGPVLAAVNRELIEKADMHLLGMIQTDFRNIDSVKKPIHTPEDLKGLKMRVQEITPHMAMVESWGAIPSAIAFTELYAAASTGVIELYEGPNYTLFMNSLYETAKYVTDTKHLANVMISAVNESFFQSLTVDQQAWVEQAADDARRAAIGIVAANNISTLDDMNSNNITIIALTEEEREAFAIPAREAGWKSIAGTVDDDFKALFEAEYENAMRSLGRN